jgi:hypothetical protein
MASVARLDDLSTQHQNLEALIEEELSRPMADSLKISELKREKLRIKEEISGLELTD